MTTVNISTEFAKEHILFIYKMYKEAIAERGEYSVVVMGYKESLYQIRMLLICLGLSELADEVLPTGWDVQEGVEGEEI